MSAWLDHLADHWYEPIWLYVAIRVFYAMN
jgi:hypothetical protein